MTSASSFLNFAGVKWLRPEQFLKTPKFVSSKTEVVQGKLADCWFLGPVAALAQRPDLLQRIFDSKDEYKDLGVYDEP